MSTAMTAKEISEAWLAFINDTFMVENGCGRPDSEDELKRLEGAGMLGYMRERDRITTDMLIAEILKCDSQDSRIKLFSITGSTSLALVQDRVQCVTQLLIEFVKKDIQINIEEEKGLEEFFRQMLFQRPA